MTVCCVERLTNPAFAYEGEGFPLTNGLMTVCCLEKLTNPAFAYEGEGFPLTSGLMTVLLREADEPCVCIRR